MCGLSFEINFYDDWLMMIIKFNYRDSKWKVTYLAVDKGLNSRSFDHHQYEGGVPW